jgi:D-xylose 1-dehydrogenase (NADP+, D-xylono-1,5-lactone-forming)
MSEPLRLGLLSTAKITGAIIGGAREAVGAEVVAVASRDRSRGEAFAAENGIGRVHGSYEALLADADIEAVYVPLPNSLHLPWSLRALEAGKHVLCEKPLSRRAADVEAAFDAAARAERILMEGFMWRYHPATELVVRLIGDGAIGRLRVVRAAFGFTLDPGADNVRWSAELEGGALMDVGCYCVSALRLLAGEPSRVSAERVDGASGVDARMAGVLRFGDGVLGTFDCAFDVPYRAGIEVVGETGTIVSLDPWHGAKPGVRILRPETEPEDVPVERADPYARELDDLARAVRSGGAPRLGREEAVGQARVIEALYRAASEGRAVAVG